jgi:Holliday junction resolvase RusA-like endonuclease
LPFPVSSNQLYGSAPRRQRFPGKKYIAWLKSCPKLEPHGLTGVHLHYRYYMPNNMARDCENYCKCVSDYLVKQGVIVDDSWQHIKSLTLTPMGIDKTKPRVEVEIS